MNAQELVLKRSGKWIFREPGFTRYGGFLGNEVIEVVEHQDFEHETEADALGHAHLYLNPPKQWFPPPPA